MRDISNGRRPVQQSFKTILPRPMPDNPYPNASSAGVAIRAAEAGWRPPLLPGKTLEVSPVGPPTIPEWAYHRIVSDPQSMDDYLNRLEGKESGGDPRARNSQSSATGRFQLTKPRAEEFGMDWERDRFNPQIQYETTVKSTEALKRDLERRGFAPTYANLHLLHVAGPSGGPKILQAPDDRPISQILRQDAIDANRRIFENKTAGEVKAWAGTEGSMDHGPAGTRWERVSPPQPVQSSQPLPRRGPSVAPTPNATPQDLILQVLRRRGLPPGLP